MPGNCWLAALSLRLLVRATSRLDNIADLPAERVVGDLRDLESLKKGMSGCEFVFHVAADYRLWARNGQELYDSNVEGTRNILQRGERIGVRRVIYTSSVATMGFGNNGRLTDEKSPVTLANMIGDYKRSKFMAEQLVIEAGRARAKRRDGEPDDADRRARHQADAERADHRGFSAAQVSRVRRYRPEPGGCASIAPRGICWRWRKRSPGERYILGGENLTLKQILDKLGGDHRPAFAEDEAALRGGVALEWSTRWSPARC